MKFSYFLRFLISIHVLSALQSTTSSRNISEIAFGMKMVERAYNVVCWYENLKVFPPPENALEKFSRCFNLQREIIDSILNQCNGTRESATNTFRSISKAETLPMLPNWYAESCSTYLDDAWKVPKNKTDEVGVGTLKDGKSAKYPYRGFAHCLIQVLRKVHGNVAINDVKYEKIYKSKQWRNVVLEQTNKARRRHGVGPLQNLEKLNEAAEEYAKEMASKCVYGHSKPENRIFHGEPSGENISGRNGGDSLDVSLSAMNAYYLEIKNFPFNVTGDALEQAVNFTSSKGYKIGHFTQMIWKDTKYVGYGLAYNYGCSENTTSPWKAYYVERYFPAGNIEKLYHENVLPPKH